jgi:hypothetical protein
MERGSQPAERGPSQATEAGARPAPYEPPAIAWEEPFEPVAATSCGLTPGFELQCSIRPQV